MTDLLRSWNHSTFNIFDTAGMSAKVDLTRSQIRQFASGTVVLPHLSAKGSFLVLPARSWDRS
jgi:hypothetical protein